MLVVVDTNVLVSALIKPRGVPARVVEENRSQALRPIVCQEIFDEYREALTRARFGFSPLQVESMLDDLAAVALHLRAEPTSTDQLPDPDDAPFIALAQTADAPIVTGNGKHFPPECSVEVLTPAQCLSRLFTE